MDLNFSVFYYVKLDITASKAYMNYTDKNNIKNLSSFQEVYQEMLNIKIINLHEDALPSFIFPVHFQILGRVYMHGCLLVKVNFY